MEQRIDGWWVRSTENGKFTAVCDDGCTFEADTLEEAVYRILAAIEREFGMTPKLISELERLRWLPKPIVLRRIGEGLDLIVGLADGSFAVSNAGYVGAVEWLLAHGCAVHALSHPYDPRKVLEPATPKSPAILAWRRFDLKIPIGMGE